MCASLESDENAEVEDMTPIARSFADGEVDVREGIVEEEEGEEDVKWVGGLLIATGCATGAVEDGVEELEAVGVEEAMVAAVVDNLPLWPLPLQGMPLLVPSSPARSRQPQHPGVCQPS